ncbi:hypothetical protein ACFWDI_33780 [Streptomyces sp. NPDC060064]|uniref:hypothetical protein n=1 Tax=Streptomyces sp. NPDC060064 TaxID=3347049 RepID=UPI0036BD0B98
MPTALDQLLQTVTTARDGDQQHAVLAQLAEQLRNAAEILEWLATTPTGVNCPPPPGNGCVRPRTPPATSPTASTR